MTDAFRHSRIASCTAAVLAMALTYGMPFEAALQEAPASGVQAPIIDAEAQGKGKAKKNDKDTCVDPDERIEDKGKGKNKDKNKAKRPRRDCVAGSSSGIAKGDFDGDGIGDLAIGVPGEEIFGRRNAGAVHVIYGAPAGLDAAAGPGDQVWSQNSPGLFGPAEGGDRFGSALAAGDFNGDGYSDLAVGAPFEDAFNKLDVGQLDVIYGSAAGLVHAVSVANSGDSNANLGAALAWGDFNDDHFGDLAVALPGPGILGGQVIVLYGTSEGLSVLNRFDKWDQDATGILDGAEVDDRFGATLSAGDFNRDGASDLAIGVPGEDVGGAKDAGAVNVIYGSGAGLRATAGPGNQFWSQADLLIPDLAETGDGFGSALAAIGFSGSDLAIGVPGEDLAPGTLQDAGLVHVLYGGSASGLVSNGSQVWAQNSTGVEGTSESGDRFGSALAGADFDGNGVRDLAIGVPGEDVGAVEDAGAVNVIYYERFGVAGLSASAGPGDQLWSLDTPGMLGTSARSDGFGFALTAWDFGNGALADLAVGAPLETVSNRPGAGAVHVIYGDTTMFPAGLSSARNQLWTEDSPDIEGIAEDGDHFGEAVY